MKSVLRAGSQRHSLLSSVTTVSSSRDELLEALENAKRHPPPPVLYESQPESSSQPTDSSVATEPGIRQFTQSPPKPNEQREASCEVPPYERELGMLARLGMLGGFGTFHNCDVWGRSMIRAVPP